MAIEIVDLPIKSGGSFHRFLYVYPRVHIPYHDHRNTQYSKVAQDLPFLQLKWDTLDVQKT